MSKNQVPVGHTHTHNPQLPWINEKTKTWWIGNHDTKQPYRGLKGDSVKGDKGDRGNMWIHIDQSTEVAPENSRDYDYLISSASEPISVAGVSLSNGEYVQVLSVNPFHVSGVIGRLKGNDGQDGTGSTGPAGNSVEVRYAKNTDSVNAPDLNRADRNPPGWTTNTINPAEGEFIWETRAYVDGENNLVGLWSEQFRNTGIGEKGDTGEKGPTTMLRFDFDPEAQYFGSNERVELVKYNGQGYQTKTTAGVIPVGTLPTNSIYWEGPIAIDNHVWADVLIAYNAYIQKLIVGSLATGIKPDEIPDPTNSGARYTVGVMPDPDPKDPTSNPDIYGPFSRYYSKSGRIACYDGIVTNLVWNDGTDDVTVNGFVRVVFKDEDNSPIHYILDQNSTGGIQYVTVTPAHWSNIGRYKFIPFTDVPSTGGLVEMTNFLQTTSSNPAYPTVLKGELFCGWFYGDSTPSGFVGFITGNSEYYGRIPASDEADQRVRWVKTNGSSANIVDDGWYLSLRRPITQSGVTSALGDALINVWLNVSCVEDGYVTQGFNINFDDQPFGQTIPPSSSTCPTHVGTTALTNVVPTDPTPGG